MTKNYSEKKSGHQKARLKNLQWQKTVTNFKMSRNYSEKIGNSTS